MSKPKSDADSLKTGIPFLSKPWLRAKEALLNPSQHSFTSAGLFLGVVVSACVLSSGVETPMRDGKVLSALGSRLVGTGIRVFYILAIVAVGLMIFSGGKKFIKK